jgi:preprotein translocase subunit SecD
MMFLPLAAFVMLADGPARRPFQPSNSPPIVFEIAAESNREAGARFEICFEKVNWAEISEAHGFGHNTLSISLNELGAKQLAAMTTAHVGAKADLVLEGEIIQSPIIHGPILSGGLAISGIRTIAQAEQLLQALRGHCTDLKADAQ